jgi:bifunctional DNA-binding transcriptional regulator/antitoxin component of YhaV-PrlF toxin-antitoxin module
MKVKIEKTKDGEAYFIIPDEYLDELQWKEDDLIDWVDNKDGTWTLRKISQLDALKEKAFSNPEVKKEYDRIGESIAKLVDSGWDETQARAIVSLLEEIEGN